MKRRGRERERERRKRRKEREAEEKKSRREDNRSKRDLFRGMSCVSFIALLACVLRYAGTFIGTHATLSQIRSYLAASKETLLQQTDSGIPLAKILNRMYRLPLMGYYHDLLLPSDPSSSSCSSSSRKNLYRVIEDDCFDVLHLTSVCASVSQWHLNAAMRYKILQNIDGE